MNAWKFLMTVTLTVLTIARATQAESKRPNLLIIHTDEHHFNTLGCYGGKIVETPHIDWLAERGAKCTSFYATTPVCSPSRAALISGRYPQNTPVVTNGIPLDDQIVSFAELFRQKGYATGYAGKWHLDGQGKPQWEPSRRFGFEDNRFMYNRGHWKKLEDTPDGPRVAARKGKGPTYSVDAADEKSFTTDWLADKTIDFIDAHQNDPFCYMVSIPDPHGPNTVRSPYDTMYDDVDVPIPATLHKTDAEIPKWGLPARGVSEQSLKRIMPAYYGMVKCIDDNVGRIIQSLRDRNLLDNTIVVFTADHGDLCGEHGRLNKGVPYEGSAKIPMVIYYPEKIEPGTVIDEALSCVDFLPTIVALAGLKTSHVAEGRDASALFTGKRPEEWNDVAFLRSTSRQGWICAVSDRHKLVYSPQDRPWLFDLCEDPDERTNRFDQAESRDVVRRLTSQLMRYIKQYDDPVGEDPKMMGEMAIAVKSK